jgi:hypothetical protein
LVIYHCTKLSNYKRAPSSQFARDRRPPVEPCIGSRDLYLVTYRSYVNFLTAAGQQGFPEKKDSGASRNTKQHYEGNSARVEIISKR